MLETVAVELCSELLFVVNLIVLIFSCTLPRRVFFELLCWREFLKKPDDAKLIGVKKFSPCLDPPLTLLVFNLRYFSSD